MDVGNDSWKYHSKRLTWEQVSSLQKITTKNAVPNFWFLNKKFQNIDFGKSSHLQRVWIKIREILFKHFFLQIINHTSWIQRVQQKNRQKSTCKSFQLNRKVHQLQSEGFFRTRPQKHFNQDAEISSVLRYWLPGNFYKVYKDDL